MVVDGLGQMDTRLQYLRLVVSQAYRPANRLRQLIAGKPTSVGQDFLNQDPLLLICEICGSIGLRLLNCRLLDEVKVVQSHPGGVINIPLPLSPGAEESPEAALVVPDIQPALIGQKAVSQHHRGGPVVAYIANLLAFMGKVTETALEILRFW